MKADGKEAFQQFYAANRKGIHRGPDGVDFPILTDGAGIYQGLGSAIAHLQAGEKLAGFFAIGVLHKEWLDGIFVSGGDAAAAEDFLAVLRHVKKNSMKLQIETNGKNADLLEAAVKEGLVDRLIMNVVGPVALYSELAGGPVEESDIRKSIALVARHPEHQFQTVISPVRRANGEVSYLTKEEVAAAAKLIEEVTGSKQQPYLLKPFPTRTAKDEAFRKLEQLESGMLLPYRSAARMYQVKAEVEKDA